MQTAIPKSIAIVGGGTAGWMAASILLHAWKTHQVEITLVESEDIGIIGVGEGSTPALRKFFSYLHIAEKEWMPACNATYKAGIYFDNWGETPGYESYFHPFYTAWDQEGAYAFVAAANSQRLGNNQQAHPNPYFLAYHLAQANRAPLPVDPQLGNQVNYGYHFDSALLGKFLRDRAKQLGLTHLIDNVEQVTLTAEGDISSIQTRQHGSIGADFFIDCTGFASLLMGKTLLEPFLSFKENLFNDAAVTLPTAIDEEIVPATRSTALGYGWAWKIPLTNRYGNGYVYSRDFISPEQAEQELRNHLGDVAKDSPARHLTMRVGRIHNHWKKNCLAVGLSQGFIEPLEATALAIVQSTLENFVDCFDQPVSETTKENYNNYINELIDGIRDYIVTHYLLNTRTDTTYWRACREQAKPSTKLEALISCWDNQGDFMDLLFKQQRAKVYKPESWFCIFAGMGRFTHLRTTKANITPTNIELTLQEKLNNIGNLYFIDHKKRLNIHC
ncbi:NAD(FAD)-dependent dehydrogenase, putative [Cellvibrio sp. BR]|uniref:tryptophan halogenase family protein n=1 Tax=Cellvibrio sp. BR TaxID=1134474 RepID=UPI0002600E8E|nr:tryptophan halogenase family protein [Cellvibrio sp. BR]EIK42880.1 NAD(FAD)-dependent dehydrogenase, putative [Cellvibrio sp. BR]